jgi:hypothetical protein
MLNDLQRRDLLIDNSDTNQRIPDTSIVQDSSQSFKNFIVTLLIFLTSPRIVSSVLSSTTAISSMIISEFIALPDKKV